MQQYSSESIQKTIELCREEMAKCDALPPVLRHTIADPSYPYVSSGEDDSQE